MERDHGRLQIRTVRRRLVPVPTLLVVIGLLLAGFWMDSAFAGVLAISASVILVSAQRERFTVRIDPQWLVVTRQFPWFARPVLERYAMVGVDRVEALLSDEGWAVRVHMRAPFRTNALLIPVDTPDAAMELAETLESEARAARARADPATTRSRIVVPPQLTELVDRRRG